MATQVERIIDKIGLYKNNPVNVKQLMYDFLDDITEGKVDVVDATTPFNFLMESSCVLTSAFLAEHEAALRKQYPSLAQTQEELYLHMCDKDYIDRFATPAMARFHLLIDLNELKSKMLEDPYTGIKVVTIPRNTEFVINDNVFSLQYPIDIKLLQHGGFQVTYDVRVPSPLQRLTSNRVDWNIVTYSANRQRMMHLEFDTYQFNITSYKGDLINATGYRKRHKFSDKFYYARVWYKNNHTLNRWREMKITHTDQVFDINDPTAVLSVYPGELEVFIPQIYLANNLVSGAIRVDIYQTKGAINLLLGDYKLDNFTANFILADEDETLDNLIDGKSPITAFRSINSVYTYANTTIIGGTDELSFEELRDRVIMNSIGAKSLPITNAQIESALERSGFDIVKNVDVVTNRQYLATKLLPDPFDEKLITAASCSIQPIISTIANLKTNSKVRDNGNRITLPPELLYRSDNSIVSVVPEVEEYELSLLEPEDRAKKINEQNYLYSPFYYVLDNSTDDFNVRAYYLNNPTAKLSAFIADNDTTGIQVSTGDFGIRKTDTGYVLLIESISNEAFKQLHPTEQVKVFLSFIPSGETVRAYLEGTLVSSPTAEGEERLYAFNLGSNFDVDKSNKIHFNTFSILNPTQQEIAVDLDTIFQIYWCTTSLMPATWKSVAEDNELPAFLLPPRKAFLTKEDLHIEFGKHLENLWTSARSIPSEASYKRYTENIKAVYEEDVYRIDPVTGGAFTFDKNGNIDYKILHKKGADVVDANGNPVYLHKKGDIVLDSTGHPIIEEESSVARQVDIMFIEGSYYFANDYTIDEQSLTAAGIYKQAITDTCVKWITEDLKTLSNQLLEQTKLYYYPKSTIGSIGVITDSNVTTNLSANQSFSVTLYVNEATYENMPLRNTLTTATIKTIDKYLKNNTTISVSGLSALLRSVYATDVIALEISGFGSDKKIQMLTVLSIGDRFAIKKKVKAQADGTLIVVEDVDVNFVLHNV